MRRLTALLGLTADNLVGIRFDHEAHVSLNMHLSGPIANFWQGDAMALPFPGPFDAAVMALGRAALARFALIDTVWASRIIQISSSSGILLS